MDASAVSKRNYYYIRIGAAPPEDILTRKPVRTYNDKVAW